MVIQNIHENLTMYQLLFKDLCILHWMHCYFKRNLLFFCQGFFSACLPQIMKKIEYIIKGENKIIFSQVLVQKYVKQLTCMKKQHTWGLCLPRQAPQQKKNEPREREIDPQKSLFFYWKISVFRPQNLIHWIWNYLNKIYNFKRHN